MPGPIQAVLFDMDGVLIDARDWHYEALNTALALFGLTISRTEHLAVYDGLPTRQKLAMLTRVHGLSPRLHDFLNAYKQKLTYQAIVEKCRPTFHHQYALARLRREGMRLAVCSNSTRATVQAMMEQAQLLEHLEFCVSNQDVRNAKPDPEIYRGAIGRMGLEPTACLVVEDNAHGIEAARGAGAHVMVVAGPADVTYDAIAAALRRFGPGMGTEAPCAT